MATSTSNVSNAKPKVGGSIWVAPYGSKLPVDSTTALDSTYKCLGYISDSGVTSHDTKSTTSIKAWGGDTVLVVTSDHEDTLSYELLEVLSVEVLKHIYGEDNVRGTLATGITVASSADNAPTVSLVAEMMLNGATKRMVYPKTILTAVGDVSYVDSDKMGYACTETALADDEGHTHYEYIKATA